MPLRRLAAAVSAALVATLAPAAVASAAAPSSWADLQHQFDYVRAPIHITTVSTTRAPGATVRNIRYEAAGHDPVVADLVTPAAAGPHPAILFLHWLDSATDSNRREFLHEAISLAEGPTHAVSLLPNLTFPFAYGPVGDVRDRDSIVQQVVQLRRGLDLLDARKDVDPSRVAVVGHDYGAMYGTILSAVDRSRVRAEVVMAADATMANWFVTYFLDLAPDQVQPYERLLSTVNPVKYLPHAPRLLMLQYATEDIYIPQSVAHRMRTAAGPDAMFRSYHVDHSLALPRAQEDRDDFVWRALNP